MSGREALSWDDARLIVAVARCGSIAKVAEALGIDATTVSRRLASVEALAGAVLFMRSHGSLKLSKLGQEILPFAGAMERAARAMNAQISHRSDTLSGDIRVSAPPTFARYVLAPALVALARQHPNIEVDLNMAAGNVDLEHSEADIAIRLNLSDSRSSNVITRALGYMSYAPFGPVDGDASERWITYSREYAHTPEAKWIGGQLAGRAPTLACNDPEIMATVAGGGTGNTLLAVILGRSRSNLRQIGPVALRRKIWMLQNRDIARATHVQVFSKWLVKVCRQKLEPAGTD